ncbi:hypothetical protein P344_06710 [Spiroplasma mirum ATCC 29335]|uniref:Uncharacterized protein n=1 Tax=Spiroplasma mirum ATCC 29335 TaxID=838561 RepID=W0GMU4_9MOLU|nr:MULTISPECIES: hypothetical protein [Spiroplasma]AHF61497.1 hypothetical protein SMM_1128 [Spiroplasma mirum ATCC 29335]AHI58641.1 hypothetical protein P344_06710 [Spiroplasma mirum ATCC 29335]AKM53536.1 hypothetical protein SATRI_v1c11980 [Spiroplasma atrichopogonis]
MSVKNILSILNLVEIKKIHNISNNLINLWASITSEENEVGKLWKFVVDYQDSYSFFTNHYSNLKKQFNGLTELNCEKEIKIKSRIAKILTITEKKHWFNE